MTNGNESVHPDTKENPQFSVPHYGLTKREHFAVMAKYDENEYSLSALQIIVGSDIPRDLQGIIEWNIKAEAAIKVMKADALIEALNKNPNHAKVSL